MLSDYGGDGMERYVEQFEVTVLDLHTKTETTASIEVETTETIAMRALAAGQEVSASNEDFFSAYQELRDQLLLRGYGIKCNGSRINAGQSGMMAGCEVVYLVELGKRATRENIVGMFNYADIDEFPNTEQQTAYFERWLNSLLS